MAANLPERRPPAVERPAPVLRHILDNPAGAGWAGELVTYASLRLSRADEARAEGHAATFAALMEAEALLWTIQRIKGRTFVQLKQHYQFLTAEWRRQRLILRTCVICGVADWGRVDCTEDGR